MADPRRLLLAALVALVGFLVLALRTPGLDSDQAINGLMGRHILRGEFPIFFYGQEHTGALENYLAALSFFLFGASRLTLNLVPAAEALLLLTLVWAVTRDAFGPRAAGWALPFLVVTPPYVGYHYVLARSSYIETLILGQLVLLLTFRLLRPSSPAARQRRFLVLGLVAGMGLYTSFQIVHYLVTAGIVLWLADLRLPLRGALWRAVPAFVLGSAPFWLYNLQRGFESLTAPARYEIEAGAFESARGLFLTQLPVILGVRDVGGAPFLPFPLFLLPPLLFIALILVVVGVEGRQWIRRVVPPGGILFLLLVLASEILWVAHYRPVPRYALPLYPAIVSLAAGGLNLLQGWHPGLALVLGGGLLVSLGLGQWQTLPALDARKLQAYQTAREQERRLFAHLERQGLTRLYTFDYWRAARLTFDAGEQIIVTLPFGDRYPRFAQMVDQAVRPGYLFAGDEALAEAGLGVAGIGFKKEVHGRVVVLHDFTPPPPAVSLPREGWRVTSRPEGGVALSTDGNVSTQWTSGGRQEPGQWLEVDLGSVVALNGVGILPGLDPHDAPRGLAVELTSDGRDWRRVAFLRSFPPTFVWAEGAPRVRPLSEFRVRFPPASARALRLIQIGEDGRDSWSVAELFLYGPGAPEPVSPPLDQARIAALRGDWREAVREAYEASRLAPRQTEAYSLLAEGFGALGLSFDPPERRARALERLGLHVLAAGEYRAALAELPPGSLRSVPVEGLVRTLDALGAAPEAEQWRTALASLRSASSPMADFGAHLRLLGVEVTPASVPVGRTFVLALAWESLSPAPRLPAIFVHLVGTGGRLVNDHMFLHGLYGPTRWHRGERLLEQYTLTIGRDTPPGQYRIHVGVWFPETGEHLRIWRGWLPTLSKRLVVGEVEIRAGSGS